MFHPLLILVGGIIFLIFIFLFILGVGIMNLFYFIFLIGLVIYIAIQALFYVFDIDVITTTQTYFNNATNTMDTQTNIIINDNDEDVNNDNIPEIKIAEQVFNIPANVFTYPDARSLCSAYGARLATYDEIEEAYNKGGEWCNYGWSENQQILFPTQKKTYDELQNIKGHENDCGRQGINGGYVSNPNARFGVNCYGYKPEITTLEAQMMQDATSPYPLTLEDIEQQKKVDFFKQNLNNILISPFNSNYWSKLL